MRFRVIQTLIIVLLITVSCQHQQSSISNQAVDFASSEYWKSQALVDILPHWSNHLIDSANHSYYTTLDVNWNANQDSIRFPSMIARHLFSYSAGYLISGNEDHIIMARNIKDYLLKYAWDKEYGGWYEALTPSGEVMHSGKSTFVQLYVITGLTMYYFVTRDPEIREYIDKSNSLLEENVWDHELGGYYDNINRDWSLKNGNKSVSSQLAPVSGYLLYLYLATHDKKYLDQSERIINTILAKMSDPTTGWILESFNNTWAYQAGRKDETEINVGHNIEVSWSLLRLYLINGNENYLKAAKQLADKLHTYGYDTNQGVWFATIGNVKPETHSDFTYWWIQAYGQMFDLNLAKIYSDKDYLNKFKQGAIFWDSYFLDKSNGDSFLSVKTNGDKINDQKANQFKASYHNMEHCLLNSLYLSCWINKEPVTLYFYITKSELGEKLYPLPIETTNIPIGDILIGGKPYQPINPTNGFITLPQLVSTNLQLTINPE